MARWISPHLDEAVEALATKLLYTMPGCLSKTLQSVRKHKLEHWDRNKESNRSWLALNMMNEANAGFRAFNEGPRGNREVDFIDLRRRLAAGERWGSELIEQVIPPRRGGEPRVSLAVETVLREVRPADVNQIAEIDAERTGTRKPAYWRRIVEEYGSGIQGRVALVAAAGRKVQGFLFGEVRAWEFGSERCGWIFSVAVRAAL